MSNAFTNFLGGVVNGIFGPGPFLRDYQHANRLYVQNTYARAPKHGFLYFVAFNLNQGVVGNTQWLARNANSVGLLVKKIDLPKFDITTEMVNQYNRKTQVQTLLKYSPINVEFHDDNSDITNGLWTNYYKYYYQDSSYGDTKAGKLKKGQLPSTYIDTKYGPIDSAYGFDNYQTIPFFETVDIYVMHQQQFTQITLVNPLITSWQHDSLNQDEGNKVLTNKMTMVFENVFYNSGYIQKDTAAGAFSAVYYDKTPSPLSVGGNGTNTLFGAGGVIAGANGVLGNLASGNILGAAIGAVTTFNNAKNLNLKQEGYSIVNGVLGNIQANGNQPGGVGSALVNGINQSGLGVLGNVGINLFSGQNSSVNGKTQATPSNITGR